MNEAAPPLAPEVSGRLTEFARACKAAARAVALYPETHPSIRLSIGRLVEASTRATADGAFGIQVAAGGLRVGGATPARPDAAIGELADLLHSHMIGGLVLHAGADAGSWRALLLLLARSPDEVRADGGIAQLWATAGGPSLEIQEIDYAELLRERAGAAAAIDSILAACLKGSPHLDLDEQAMSDLLRLARDPDALRDFVRDLETRAAEQGVLVPTAILKLLQALAAFAAQADPSQLEPLLRSMAQATGTLTVETMHDLLGRRGTPEAAAGPVPDLVGAVVERMTDRTVAHFVAGSVIAERGPSDRLAQVFQAMAPEPDQRRQLLALAGQEVADSPLGQEEAFPELWSRVETMLTSYSDEPFVSTDYGRELSGARAQAVEVERVSDDPPERIGAWLSTVSDAALRALDQQLLLDLLVIEPDASRWRDIAETAAGHANDLARVQHTEPAVHLAQTIVREAAAGDHPERAGAAATALTRLGEGALLRQTVGQLRACAEETVEQLGRLCHAIGPPAIRPLAEALAGEQDTRTRQRLQDLLLGFGPGGREAVEELMQAPGWEVRRTAAFLLREMGGASGLPSLEPLLNDSEPRVQREALRSIVLYGDSRAYDALLRALTTAAPPVRESLAAEIEQFRDERAAPLFAYLLPRLDRRARAATCLSLIDALGALGGPEAVDVLKQALSEGDWRAPLQTRRFRTAAAAALRRVGTPAAIDALREAAARGSWGARSAARRQLARGAPLRPERS